jgi:photosystem II PsbY protein
MDLDLRILIVLLPVLLAGGWAFTKVGQIALEQAKGFLSKS